MVDASTYPLKVVDDVSGVAASEVWHGDADLLVVVLQVDAHVLLQLLPAPQRSVHRVLVHHPAVEQAVLGDLLMGRGRAGLARDKPPTDRRRVSEERQSDATCGMK